jgi:hypothetical protein
MPRQVHHVFGELHVGDVVEIFAGIPHFIRKAQQRPHQALAARRDGDHVLAAGQHDAADRDHLHLLYDVADDHEGVLADIAVWSDIVRTDVVELVDFAPRHELVDIDRLGAFERDRFQFLVGDLDILAFGDFVSLDDLLRRDFLAALGVDLAVADAVAGGAVDLIETDLLALGGRREQGYRARNQRKPQIAFPISTRGHDTLLPSQPLTTIWIIACSGLSRAGIRSLVSYLFYAGLF